MGWRSWPYGLEVVAPWGGGRGLMGWRPLSHWMEAVGRWAGGRTANLRFEQEAREEAEAGTVEVAMELALVSQLDPAAPLEVRRAL